MPIIRLDVPQGHPRHVLLELKRGIEDAIARTWAKEHIYVALHEMLTEKDDRTAIMTVDLRPGRGSENERSSALYQLAASSLEKCIGTDRQHFVLLIREFKEDCFVVSGGTRLPALDRITPVLEQV